jgi:hypothetical protein
MGMCGVSMHHCGPCRECLVYHADGSGRESYKPALLAVEKTGGGTIVKA